MTGAFIVGWYLAVSVYDGSSSSISQFGPYIDKESCESAKAYIKQEFGSYIFKAACTPSDKDLSK